MNVGEISSLLFFRYKSCIDINKMSQILANISLIQKLSQTIIRSRNFNYLEDSIDTMVDLSRFHIQNFSNLANKSGCILKSSLITHKTNLNTQFVNTKCIIYLHGLGSNRTQAFYLTKYLPKKYCLFAFDFQGYGKSIGSQITYGLQESEDIEAVIQYLRKNTKIKEFILWGRSMGAVAGLLYSINLAEYEKLSILPRDTLSRIKGMIIDSPFCDFSEITKQIAIKKLNIPEFLIEIVLKSIDTNITDLLKTKRNYNPFHIKLGDQSIETRIPTIFLHSSSDQVVPKEHSQKIMRMYKSPFQKIEMNSYSHNEFRGEEILNEIFQYLNKFELKYHRIRPSQFERNDLSRNSSKKGINVQSKQKYKSILKKIGPSSSKKVKNKHNETNKKISCKTESSEFSLSNSFQNQKPIKNFQFIRQVQKCKEMQKNKISLSGLEKIINNKSYKQIQDNHPALISRQNSLNFENQMSREGKYGMAAPPLPKHSQKPLSNQIYCNNNLMPFHIL